MLLKEQVKILTKKLEYLNKKKRELLEGYITEKRGMLCSGREGISADIDNGTRDTLLRIEDEINELKKILKDGETLESNPSCKIGLGSSFTILIDGELEKENYTLVQEITGLKIDQGYISIKSPIGKAVNGKSVGDEFYVHVLPAHSKASSYQLRGTIHEIHNVVPTKEKQGKVLKKTSL